LAAWQADHFSPSPKVKLFYRALVPEKVKGHVLVIHGYAEHSGRYLPIMEALAANGYAAWAPDHRGCGRSTKRLGDMKSYERILADLVVFKEYIKLHFNAVPVFLLGHSLGASLALALAGRSPGGIRGVIAIAAMIMIPDYISPFLLKLSRVSAALFPRLQAQPFKKNSVSRDEKVLDAARQDPLYYRGKIMARTGYQMIVGIKMTRALLPSISAPLLLLHGGGDRIMPPQGSRYILDTVRGKDKTLRVFDNLYHEILNEPEKEEVFKTILGWIEKHNA
jgi:alpha-beta hydrolase superfamily lysophospholipase